MSKGKSSSPRGPLRNLLLDYPQQELSRICERLGLEFFDLLPCMRMYNSTRLFYDHCHLNLAGNEVSAECMKDF